MCLVKLEISLQRYFVEKIKIEKNQFSINQMLKDEIEKRKNCKQI